MKNTVLILVIVVFSGILLAQDTTMSIKCELTKKGNNVFVISDVENVDIHARESLKKWNYWNVVDNRDNADFILDFVLSFTWPDYYGFVRFVDPETGKAFYISGRVNTVMSWDFNTKRAVVNKIIKKEIKRKI